MRDAFKYLFMRGGKTASSGRSDVKSRWAILALTRFILASIVVTGHLAVLSHALHWRDGWAFGGLWFNQGSAVFAFFIISGYSIAASIESKSDGFFRRRCLRIYPLYTLALLFAAFVGFLIQPSIILGDGKVITPDSAMRLIASFFMLQTFLVPPLNLDGPLWSLAPEWWLYMTAPFLRKIASPVLAALIVLSLSYDIFHAPSDISLAGHGKVFLCTAWYWLSGFFYYRHRRTPVGFAMLCVPVMIAYASGIFVGRAVILGLIAVALCDEIRIGKKLQPLFDRLGDLSYPLYLFHIPLIILMQFMGVTANLPVFLAALGLSFFAYYCCEIPIKNFFKKRT